MDVSGRKPGDRQGTVSKDTDQFCDACITTGLKVGAHKYCLDCGEYLCKTCSDCHLKTRISRNHQLVDKDKQGKQSTAGVKDFKVDTEKCQEHKQEEIKYFCPRHEALGCHACIIMNHRACDVDYIPSKCADIAESTEYRSTMQKLDQKVKELNDIRDMAKARNKVIETSYDDLMKEITKFRKEINDRLDKLQQAIQNEADKMKTIDQGIIRKVIEVCERLSSDVKKLQSRLHANRTSRQNEHLYITMKQAQSTLKSKEFQEDGGDLERTEMQYTFERNTALESLLSSQQAIFGKISPHSVLDTQGKMKRFDKLIEINGIDIGASECPWITGCVVLSPNLLVIVDNYVKKIKVVDIPNKTVIEDKYVDPQPHGITLLPQDHIAVVVPKANKSEVAIMKWRDKLTNIRTFEVEGECKGITYHQNHLYVLCNNLSRVVILDMKGNVQSKISVSSVKSDSYIAICGKSKRIYISDTDNDCLASITLQGRVSDVYRHKDFRGPRGLAVLDDGSILACSNADVIYQISADFTQCRKIASISTHFYPWSLCYNESRNEVYVGSYGNAQIQ